MEQHDSRALAPPNDVPFLRVSFLLPPPSLLSAFSSTFVRTGSSLVLRSRRARNPLTQPRSRAVVLSRAPAPLRPRAPPFLQCFSVGLEEGAHENTHDYRVVDNMKFPLFHPDWGADEEMRLLTAMEARGFGNWVDVAQSVSTKTAAECQRHYLTTYINTPTRPLPSPKLLEQRIQQAKAQGLQAAARAGAQRPSSAAGAGAAGAAGAGAAAAAAQPPKLSKTGKNKKRSTGGKTVAAVESAVAEQSSELIMQGSRRSRNKQETAAAGGGGGSAGGASDGGGAATISEADLPAATLGNEHAGYYPFRQDFTLEYDDDCEKLVSGIVFYDDDSPQDVQLKVTMLEIYNSR